MEPEQSGRRVYGRGVGGRQAKPGSHMFHAEWKAKIINRQQSDTTNCGRDRNKNSVRRFVAGTSVDRLDTITNKIPNKHTISKVTQQQKTLPNTWYEINNGCTQSKEEKKRKKKELRLNHTGKRTCTVAAILHLAAFSGIRRSTNEATGFEW